MKNFSTSRKANFSSQKGLTLVEILVSVLVMGIGALGVASMQITGLKYSAGAQTRTQASLLASDMLDRIRANRLTAISTVLYNTQGFQSSVSTPSVNCYQSDCNGAALVAYDKWAWLNQVRTLLPNSQAQIVSEDINSDQRMFQITLRWRFIANEQGGDASEEFQQFTFRGVI